MGNEHRPRAVMEVRLIAVVNEAIVDITHCPRCTTHDVYLLLFITEQNLVGIYAAAVSDFAANEYT